MKLAPLQLYDYFLTYLEVSANPNYDPKLQSHILDELLIEHNVSQIETTSSEGTHWRVNLSITKKRKEKSNDPYSFSLAIQGRVLVFDSIPKERLETVVQANAPAMLFGAAREIIRAATGRGPWDAVIIPSTNFLANTPSKKESQKISETPQTKAKKKAASKPKSKTKK